MAEIAGRKAGMGIGAIKGAVLGAAFAERDLSLTRIGRVVEGAGVALA